VIPLVLQKPDFFSISFKTDAPFSTDIKLRNSTSEILGKLLIPAGSFNGAPNNETVIRFEPVPDSEIRMVGNAQEVQILSSVFRIIVEPFIVQPFPIPVKISFFLNLPPNTTNTTICLSYINSTGDWDCEDLQLSLENNGMYSGYTTHFTDYSILLGGSGHGNGGSGSSSSSSSSSTTTSGTNTDSGTPTSTSGSASGEVSDGGNETKSPYSPPILIGASIGIIVVVGGITGIAIYVTRRKAKKGGMDLNKMKNDNGNGIELKASNNSLENRN